MGLPHIHEKLVHDLRLIDWANIVHPTADGYVTVATRSKTGWKEQQRMRAILMRFMLI